MEVYPNELFRTLTYNDALHTEDSFRKKLRNCLSLLSNRKVWKYIGLWECSPEKKRLLFHGVFDIPKGSMLGYFIQKEDYSFKSHRRQIANQNTCFLENYGRNFISDIMDEDIVCTVGTEDQKLLLFDDFGCWDEGEYIGQVSKETIAKMPKAN